MARHAWVAAWLLLAGLVPQAALAANCPSGSDQDITINTPCTMSGAQAYSYKSLTVLAEVTVAGCTTFPTIHVANNMHIVYSGSLHADGQGYGPGLGPMPGAGNTAVSFLSCFHRFSIPSFRVPWPTFITYRRCVSSCCCFLVLLPCRLFPFFILFIYLFTYSLMLFFSY